MADDTAALVLSLEARFDKFEKAMKDVGKVVEQQTKSIEQNFEKMTDAITSRLERIQGTLTSRLGLAGELLSKLGPIGIAAAVGIGAAVFALEKAADWTLRFGESMKTLRDLSITTGLSAQTLQVLKKAAQDIGVEFDQVTPSIERFVRNWELLKRGQGDLRTELLRTNAALAGQLNSAESETEAVQILTNAFKGLTASQAQLLSRTAFGRTGGSDALRFFTKGFDLATLQQNAAAANKIINDDIVLKTAESFDKLQANFKKAENAIPKAFGRMFAPELLERANAWMVELNKRIESGLDVIEGRVGKTSENFNKRVQDAFSALPEQPQPLRLTVTPAPQVRPLTPDETAARSRERIQFLGEAATAQERLTNARLQAAAAARQNLPLEKDLGRVYAEATAASQRQTLQAKEQLGVATEQEIKTGKLIEVERQRVQFALTASQAERAAIIATKEAREQYEAVLVRQSNMPQLTRLALDANNLTKAIDSFATTSLNTMVDSMADAVTGAKSLSDAFSEMAQTILKEMSRMIIKQLILGPLMKSFGFPLTPMMAGGPVSAGQPLLVGERGPELFIPSGAGQIIPNHRIESGAVSIVGPTTNVNIEGNADRRTIATMQQMLAQRDKRFVADVAAATSELRRRSVRT